jgi:hypothetical protein
LQAQNVIFDLSLNASLEHQLFESQEWEIFDSMFALLKHQNEYALASNLQVANLPQRELEQTISSSAAILLGCRSMKDEECCLVCGLTDYEEDN